MASNSRSIAFPSGLAGEVEHWCCCCRTRIHLRAAAPTGGPAGLRVVGAAIVSLPLETRNDNVEEHHQSSACGPGTRS